MLKLFRDYVFHAVDENGLPWMDMSHMVMCLNKVKCYYYCCPCLVLVWDNTQG